MRYIIKAVANIRSYIGFAIFPEKISLPKNDKTNIPATIIAKTNMADSEITSRFTAGVVLYRLIMLGFRVILTRS